MKYKIWEASYESKLFQIVEDLPEVGAYIFIYDENGNCLADYLQNSVELCKEFAFADFDVPYDTWIFKGYKQ